MYAEDKSEHMERAIPYYPYPYLYPYSREFRTASSHFMTASPNSESGTETWAIQKVEHSILFTYFACSQCLHSHFFSLFLFSFLTTTMMIMN